jgi:hypothetical protein
MEVRGDNQSTSLDLFCCSSSHGKNERPVRVNSNWTGLFVRGGRCIRRVEVDRRTKNLSGNVEETKCLEVEIVSDIDPPILALSAAPCNFGCRTMNDRAVSKIATPKNGAASCGVFIIPRKRDKLVPVQIFGTTFDSGSGIKSVHVDVIDEYGTCQPAVPDIGPGDIINGNWIRTIQLEASRQGNDKDGRKYTIRVTATDNAGNTTVKEIVVVAHMTRDCRHVKRGRR